MLASLLWPSPPQGSVINLALLSRSREGPKCFWRCHPFLDLASNIQR